MKTRLMIPIILCIFIISSCRRGPDIPAPTLTPDFLATVNYTLRQTPTATIRPTATAINMSYESDTAVEGEAVSVEITGGLVSMAASGERLYASTPASFLVIDAGGPVSPTIRGEIAFPQGVEALAVRGETIFLAGGDGMLYCIDASSPVEPNILGTAPAPEHIRALAVSGDYLYAAAESGFYVFDIYDPAFPSQAGALDNQQADYDVAVSGSYAYITEGIGFSVVDISDPAEPRRVGAFQIPATQSGCSSPGGLALAGEFVYLADNCNGVWVVSIADPLAPKKTALYWSTLGAGDVAITGRTLYVVSWEQGVDVVDISNPRAPIRLGVFDQPGYVLDVAAAEGRVYASDSALWYFPVSKFGRPPQDLLAAVSNQVVKSTPIPAAMENIEVVGIYEDEGSWSLAVQDAIVYLGAQDRLVILDATNPSRPRKLGELAGLPGRVEEIQAMGQLLYLAVYGPTGGSLRIVDASNPAAPVELGATAIPGQMQGLGLDFPYVYACAGENGLHIYDISDVKAITETGSIDTPGFAQSIVLRDTLAYVADSYNGIRVIDIADPAFPVELGSTERSMEPEGPPILEIAIEGEMLYAAAEYAGLYVYDLTNPLQPRLSGMWAPGGLSVAAAVDGSTAWLAGESGMVALDVSDPGKIIEVGNYKPPVEMEGGLLVYDVVISEGKIYLADGGLKILVHP